MEKASKITFGISVIDGEKSEDKHSFSEDTGGTFCLSFFGVFDGHNGVGKRKIYCT